LLGVGQRNAKRIAPAIPVAVLVALRYEFDVMGRSVGERFLDSAIRVQQRLKVEQP
jgi:hypothetical protein